MNNVSFVCEDWSLLGCHTFFLLVWNVIGHLFSSSSIPRRLDLSDHLILKMKALQSLWTLGTTCPVKQHRIEKTNLHQHSCENFKSCNFVFCEFCHSLIMVVKIFEEYHLKRNFLMTVTVISILYPVKAIRNIIRRKWRKHFAGRWHRCTGIFNIQVWQMKLCAIMKVIPRHYVRFLFVSCFLGKSGLWKWIWLNFGWVSCHQRPAQFQPFKFLSLGVTLSSFNVASWKCVVIDL